MKPAQLRRRGQRTFRSGPYLPLDGRGQAIRLLFVATDHTRAEVERLIARLCELQQGQHIIKPILLLSSKHRWPIETRGIVYETCLDADGLFVVGSDTDWADYQKGRIDAMQLAYAPHNLCVLAAGELPTAEEIRKWLSTEGPTR